MALREEVVSLNEDTTAIKQRIAAVMRAEKILDTLTQYFEYIERPNAASILKNKKKHDQTAINYLHELADIIEKHK